MRKKVITGKGKKSVSQLNSMRFDERKELKSGYSRPYTYLCAIKTKARAGVKKGRRL